MRAKELRRRFLWLLLVAVTAVLIVAGVMSGAGPEPIGLRLFIDKVKEEQIDAIQQTRDTLIALKGGEAKYKTHFDGSTEELWQLLESEGVDPRIVAPIVGSVDWRAIGLTVILPIVLLGVLLYFLISRLYQISRSLQQLIELKLIELKEGAKPETKEMQTKAIDSAEAIRKLAELRDQGILTQEEFEQKKKKLL